MLIGSQGGVKTSFCRFVQSNSHQPEVFYLLEARFSLDRWFVALGWDGCLFDGEDLVGIEFILTFCSCYLHHERASG